MKKDQVNSFLGKIVNVAFNDGSYALGPLEFVPAFNAKYGFRHPGYFYVGNVGLKCLNMLDFSEHCNGLMKAGYKLDVDLRKNLLR